MLVSDEGVRIIGRELPKGALYVPLCAGGDFRLYHLTDISRNDGEWRPGGARPSKGKQ